MPVDERFLRSELARVDSEIGRLDELRDYHVGQDEERWAVHHREHARLETNLTDRFEKVNEFRLALSDLGREMATRREVESIQVTNAAALDAAIASLRAAGESRARTTLGILGLVLTAIIVAATIFSSVHQQPTVVQFPGAVVPTTTAASVP